MKIGHRLWLLVVAFGLVFILSPSALSHPLGNFTINHYTRIEVTVDRIKLRYVIDMAEIPAFQEFQKITGNGGRLPTEIQLRDYAIQVAPQYADGLMIVVDDARVPLEVQAARAMTVSTAGGLQTLRIECDFAAAAQSTSSARKAQFADNNFSDRLGWSELVISPSPGIAVFDSAAFGNGITDELKVYPADLLTTPLDERAADFSFATGSVPIGSHALSTRNGRTLAGPPRDRLAELIAVPDLTIGVALTSLLLAVLLGGFHALSPGHGKTIVGAYLVGSRGTVKHAAFLGLTVTITHTAGVFALGLTTLFASQYFVPERLFPILSVLSGAIVVVIGANMLWRRWRSLRGRSDHHHRIDHRHDHSHKHDHHFDPTQPHSHGGRVHSHLPPGADGAPVTWRSLLALGISGGILPCPSALVVLLAAISLHRVGYGLLLVVAFSLGLAGALTIVGLAFVYGSRFLKPSGKFERLAAIVPVASSVVITCAGLAICYAGLKEAGIDLSSIAIDIGRQFRALNSHEGSLKSLGSIGMLSLGLIFGLKHATEIDHVVAVSAIVSEEKKIIRAALVGALWGAGHTASLVSVGVIVLVLRISIPDSVSGWLEFGVALMIIGLGVTALIRALRNRAVFHVHQHDHGTGAHTHFHFHEHEDLAAPSTRHSHKIKRLGLKPLIVGAMHGLAGSAALTLLVLSQIDSLTLGLLYLLVFGGGSIVGMLIMSGLMGLPFALSSNRLVKFHYRLQLLAGWFSVLFGIWYAYETGIASLLMRSLVRV